MLDEMMEVRCVEPVLILISMGSTAEYHENRSALHPRAEGSVVLLFWSSEEMFLFLGEYRVIFEANNELLSSVPPGPLFSSSAVFHKPTSLLTTLYRFSGQNRTFSYPLFVRSV
jgi:hypothetical protein